MKADSRFDILSRSSGSQAVPRRLACFLKVFWLHFLDLGLSWAPFLEPLGSILGGLGITLPALGSLGASWRRFGRRGGSGSEKLVRWTPLGSQNWAKFHLKIVEILYQKNKWCFEGLFIRFLMILGAKMGPVLSKNLIGCKHCYKKGDMPKTL